MNTSIQKYLDAGKAISRQKSSSRLSETFRLFLHRLVTGYGVDHYVTYSLFNTPINFKDWRLYLDKRDFCTLLFRYNKKEHFKVLEDKVMFAELCRQHSLPHPEILFTCNYPHQCSPMDSSTTDSIANRFTELPPGVFIVKTCGGSYGINLWSIERTHQGLQVHNQKRSLTPRQFAELLEETGESYLVQKRISVARSLRDIMPGIGCGTIRVMTFLRSDGSVNIPFCFIKLTTENALSDNFSGNSWGNMLAMIDLNQNRIRRVVGKAENGLYSEVADHPDTGVNLPGYLIAELDQALDLGRRCALSFPRIPAVGWDIVLTEHGAQVLEGNPMFDPIGPQLCAESGIKDIVPGLLEESHAGTH